MIRQSYVVGAGKLVPESFEARQQLDAISVGERVEVVIYRERNPKFDGLLFKAFDLVGAAMGWRTRNVRGWLAIKTGRADVVEWPPHDKRSGFLVPHSTSPADMGTAELEAFWEDATVTIRNEVLPHIAPEAAEQISWRLEDLRRQ